MGTVEYKNNEIGSAFPFVSAEENRVMCPYSTLLVS
jgi:hypothetical protein